VLTGGLYFFAALFLLPFENQGACTVGIWRARRSDKEK
jgi:hypothetical protein